MEDEEEAPVPRGGRVIGARRGVSYREGSADECGGGCAP